MKKMEEKQEEEFLVNPLRNETITVKFVPSQNGITDKRHVLYGGMSDTSYRAYTVPRQRNGELKNPLTNEEKKYFEDLMGIDLSIYKDYWKNYVVKIYKEGLTLNLADVDDYLKYKVLLANSTLIAPSVEEYKRFPKATYQFVLTSDKKDIESGIDRISYKKECYKLIGKYEEDFDTMRIITELYTGRPVSNETKLEALQVQVDRFTEEDPHKVYDIISDPTLTTIVMIRRLLEQGTIYTRGDFYYLRADNMPLCEKGQDPTMKNAARFLNSPKHQELFLTLQAKLTSDK